MTLLTIDNTIAVSLALSMCYHACDHHDAGGDGHHKPCCPCLESILCVGLQERAMLCLLFPKSIADVSLYLSTYLSIYLVTIGLYLRKYVHMRYSVILTNTCNSHACTYTHARTRTDSQTYRQTDRETETDTHTHMCRSPI